MALVLAGTPMHLLRTWLIFIGISAVNVLDVGV